MRQHNGLKRTPNSGRLGCSVSVFQPNPKGYQNGWFSKWQVLIAKTIVRNGKTDPVQFETGPGQFLHSQTRQFGTRLFWYPFGFLLSSTHKGYENRWVWKWQVLWMLKNWHFAACLFWYPFGRLQVLGGQVYRAKLTRKIFQHFSNMPSVKWPLGFAKVPYQGHPLSLPGPLRMPKSNPKETYLVPPEGHISVKNMWRNSQVVQTHSTRGAPSPYTTPPECPKILKKRVLGTRPEGELAQGMLPQGTFEKQRFCSFANITTKNAPKVSPTFWSLYSVGPIKCRRIPAKYPPRLPSWWAFLDGPFSAMAGCSKTAH